jgi:hypothetical protein
VARAHHADAAFTLRTYVHLMDEGIGDADFLDAAVVAAPLSPLHGEVPRGDVRDIRATK